MAETVKLQASLHQIFMLDEKQWRIINQKVALLNAGMAESCIDVGGCTEPPDFAQPIPRVSHGPVFGSRSF